jgi:hypothetical protein
MNDIRPRSQRSTAIAIAAVWIVVGTSVLVDLMGVITMTTGRVLFTSGGADGRLPLSYLPQFLQADLREGTTGYLIDAPLWFRVLCSSPTLIHAVTIVLAAVVFIHILRGIASGRPFAPSVLRDWSRVSVVLIVGGVLQGLVDTVAGVVIFSLANAGRSMGEHPFGADYSGIGVDFPQWPFYMILVGIVAAAIAAAFRSGARLEEEVVGVV